MSPHRSKLSFPPDGACRDLFLDEAMRTCAIPVYGCAQGCFYSDMTDTYTDLVPEGRVHRRVYTDPDVFAADTRTSAGALRAVNASGIRQSDAANMMLMRVGDRASPSRPHHPEVDNCAERCCVITVLAVEGGRVRGTTERYVL